jgi:hypothetical protein
MKPQTLSSAGVRRADQMQRRLICFAGSSVVTEYEGQRAARIVDFLYQHMPAGDDRGSAPHVTYRVASGGEAGKLALYQGADLLYEGDCEATLAEMLLGETGHSLADKSRGGLLFHAGALVWKGKGLLLPGDIGAGKTTLTAWLALKPTGSLEYLTDELVFFPDGADAMQTYTRPLNLKRPARTALEDLFDFEGDSNGILSTPYGDLISPDLVNFAGPRDETPLSLIVFPRYAAGNEFELKRLSKAQAGLALMECLVNARNLPEHGFRELARLARTAPAFKMSYAHFDQIGEGVEALIRSIA